MEFQWLFSVVQQGLLGLSQAFFSVTDSHKLLPLYTEHSRWWQTMEHVVFNLFISLHPANRASLFSVLSGPCCID